MKIREKIIHVANGKIVITSLLMMFLSSNSNYFLIELEQPKIHSKSVGRAMVIPTAQSVKNDSSSTSKTSTNNLLIEHPNSFKINAKHCGIDGNQKSSERIIGGTDTKKGEFPWLALLRIPYGHWKCGGSLINQEWILTAAHCVTKEVEGSCNPSINERLEIMIGHYNMKKTSNAVILKSMNVIPHKKFSYCSGDSDIALIKLKKSINVKKYKNVNTICLPLEQPADIKAGLKVTVVGHGNTENIKDKNGQWYSSKSANIMKRLDTTLVRTESCIAAYNKLVGRHLSIKKGQNMCTRALEGQDSCRGDSGGPLMTAIDNEKMSEKQWIQVGIVSWGLDKCGMKGIPGVYTSVKDYLKWVLDNMN